MGVEKDRERNGNRKGEKKKRECKNGRDRKDSGKRGEEETGVEKRYIKKRQWKKGRERKKSGKRGEEGTGEENYIWKNGSGKW